MADVPKSPKT